MAPNSAPMPVATRPLTINPVMMGPLSLMIETTRSAGAGIWRQHVGLNPYDGGGMCPFNL
jgi:hypothetical protein